MAWTDPSGHVYATGEVVSASTLNTYIKDNLLDLDRRTTPDEDFVATSETTTSTSFTDLATSGPAVTVDVGASGMCMVGVYLHGRNSSSNENCIMGFAVGGASTVAAAVDMSVATLHTSTTTNQAIGATFVITGLTTGSNTFTAKYRVTAGTGTFANRRIFAMPIGE